MTRGKGNKEIKKGGQGEWEKQNDLWKCSVLTALSLFIKCFGCTRAEGMHRGAACSSPWHSNVPLSIVSLRQTHVSTCPPQSKANMHHPERKFVHTKDLLRVCLVLTSSTDWYIKSLTSALWSQRQGFGSWSPHRGYSDKWLCRSCAGTTECLLLVHLSLLQLCGCRLWWERKYTGLTGFTPRHADMDKFTLRGFFFFKITYPKSPMALNNPLSVLINHLCMYMLQHFQKFCFSTSCFPSTPCKKVLASQIRQWSCKTSYYWPCHRPITQTYSQVVTVNSFHEYKSGSKNKHLFEVPDDPKPYTLILAATLCLQLRVFDFHNCYFINLLKPFPLLTCVISVHHLY